jgi:predicted negative regulator of RcsB-dependent stress response
VVDQEYEIKFHVYDGNESDPENFLTEFTTLQGKFKSEGSVMSKVISYFFDGLVALVDGDMNFTNNQYRDAYTNYVEASKMFQRFMNSRNVQVRLDLLASRLNHRSKGNQKLNESLLAPDHELRDDMLLTALNHYNNEVNIANEMGDQMSSYAAFSRASLAQSQILLFRGREQIESNSSESKKNLLESRVAVRQAVFINSSFKQYYEEIEEQLEDITRIRLLSKAEAFGDEATLYSENGEYEKCKINNKKAASFYKRAAAIATDGTSRRFFLSSATILEASIKEAEANKNLKQNDQPADASDNFEEAGKYVEKAVALMGRFGNDELIVNFKCQRDYYNAMSSMASAVAIFDEDKYEDAMKLFKEAEEHFNSIADQSEKIDNEVLTRLSNEGSAEIRGYITMCENLL